MTTRERDPRKIRVLIAVDSPLARERMKAMLRTSGFDVVGEARDGSHAETAARDLKPTVVIVDLALPEWGGLDATRRVRAQAPESRVLLASGYGGVDVLREAIACGAAGYVLKDASQQAYADAVTMAASGAFVIDKRLLKELDDVMAPPDQIAPAQDASGVTVAERELVRLVLEGVSCEQIAAQSGRTVDSIRDVIQRILASAGRQVTNQ